jgi:hypothetical protein
MRVKVFIIGNLGERGASFLVLHLLVKKSFYFKNKHK